MTPAAQPITLIKFYLDHQAQAGTTPTQTKQQEQPAS